MTDDLRACAVGRRRHERYDLCPSFPLSSLVVDLFLSFLRFSFRSSLRPPASLTQSDRSPAREETTTRDRRRHGTAPWMESTRP